MSELKCERCGLETSDIENGLCYICQDDNKDKGIDYSKDNVFDAIGRPDLKPLDDFQKIPKEEFENGISDTAQSYQAGYIAGIERGKEQLLEELEIYIRKVSRYTEVKNTQGVFNKKNIIDVNTLIRYIKTYQK